MRLAVRRAETHRCNLFLDRRGPAGSRVSCENDVGARRIGEWQQRMAYVPRRVLRLSTAGRRPRAEADFIDPEFVSVVARARRKRASARRR